MIPKIIHLAWFSGDPYPPMVEDCIKTWKKVLPEYEIKFWNMEMAKSLHIPYIDEALKCKMWAFASDVVRAYAVWKYGGVYMDSDIYVLKPFDKYLNRRLVLFNEFDFNSYHRLLNNHIIDKEGNRLRKDILINGMLIQAACFMGEKGHPYLKEVVDQYRTMHFIDKEGKPVTSVTAPNVYADVLERYGFKYNNEVQDLREGIHVGSCREVPGDRYKKFPETIAIHCVQHSWDPLSFYYRFRLHVKKLLGIRGHTVIDVREI